MAALQCSPFGTSATKCNVAWRSSTPPHPSPGPFSGLLAYGIQHMDGVAGLPGWKWIFILEGLLPVAGSFCVWFLLPDDPETARFPHEG